MISRHSLRQTQGEIKDLLVLAQINDGRPTSASSYIQAAVLNVEELPGERRGSYVWSECPI
jgi:hypothetical protein